MTDFTPDPRLKDDTIHVGELILSRILLMNDNRYPWLILVPRRHGLREIHDLAPEDQIYLLPEITRITHVLNKIHNPDKINIGVLGNIVNQLHIHILGRFEGDAAWPGPVWGAGNPVAYDCENTYLSLCIPVSQSVSQYLVLL